MEGYISIQRKIKDHWVFERDDYFKAWIVMLMEVNHKERKVLVKGKAIKCEVGQSLKSLDSWAASFGNGWTRQKVRTFFKILESDEMIKTEPIFKTTTKLTICNYGDYQGKQPTANQQLTKEQPTANQGATTNNNDNNDNNDNKKKYNIREHLSSLGCDSKLISEWLLVRKNKKASNTETSINRWMSNVDKSNLSYNEALKVCVENSWVGFNKEWLPKQQSVKVVGGVNMDYIKEQQKLYYGDTK